MMQVVCVNIGKAQRLAQKTPRSKTAAFTGIYKQPVRETVEIGVLGLNGDDIIDKKHHGGLDQAVYLYSVEDYDWWSQELERPVSAGLFGENFTISGVDGGSVCVGDRFIINELVLEVTSPRIPCATLCARMGDLSFAKKFMKAGRPGIYCRVLNEGSVSAGDEIQRHKFNGEQITMREMFYGYPFKDVSEAEKRRYLSVPVHWKVRGYFEGTRKKP